MSARLKKHALLLKVLAEAQPHMCKAIIREGDRELITCLCECAKNILNGNVPLKKSHLKRLQRYRKDVRTIVKKRTSKHKKKKILQKGGFLSALLAPIAAEVLTKLI
jgi:hypothetical protein